MTLLRFELPPPKKILKSLLVVLIVIVFILKCINSFYFKRFTQSKLFGGDEPKYFRMVHSLAMDGDLDLSNIWGDEEEMEKIKAELLASGSRRFGDLYIVGRNGGIYCLLMPGSSFLMLPSYILDSFFYPNDPAKAPSNLSFLPHKLYFTRLWLIVVGILTLILLSRLIYHLFSSFFLWVFLILLFILNSPFSAYVFEVYPDFWASFFCLLVLNAIFHPFKNGILNDFLIIVGIGFIPWLHQRLILLSLGLYLAFLLYGVARGIRFRKVCVLSLILLIVSLLYFYYFYSITGNPSPMSTSKQFGKFYARINVLPLGFFGYFFSRDNSIIWIYPWVILFFFGIYWGFKMNPKLSISILFIIIPYYLIACSAIPWDGVTRPLGRYLVPIFPLFLIFSGITIKDLFKKFSFAKLFFYCAYFILIFLNTRLWFINFGFGYSYITPADITWIIKSIIIIFFFYFSLFISVKFLFPKNGKEIRYNSI